MMSEQGKRPASRARDWASETWEKESGWRKGPIVPFNPSPHPGTKVVRLPLVSGRQPHHPTPEAERAWAIPQDDWQEYSGRGKWWGRRKKNGEVG